MIGGVVVGFFAWIKIRMFRVLWENERNGNYLMTQRLSRLESERGNRRGVQR